MKNNVISKIEKKVQLLFVETVKEIREVVLLRLLLV